MLSTRTAALLLGATLAAAPSATLAQRPDPADTAMARARAAYDVRHYAQARKLLEPLVEKGAGLPESAELLGRVLLWQGDAGHAARLLEKAVALHPDDAAYHMWLGRADGVRARGASLFRAPGLARRARAEFERALSLDSTNIDARLGLVDFLLEAPGFLGGDKDRADQEARRLADLDPWAGYLAAIRVRLARKDTASARTILDHARAARPDSIAGNHWLEGLILEAEGHTDAAVRAYLAALDADSTHYNARRALARLRGS